MMRTVLETARREDGCTTEQSQKHRMEQLRKPFQKTRERWPG
jgi:hypothetical protein